MTGINRHLGRFLLFLSKLPLSVKRLAKKKGVGGLLLPSCGPSISGLNVLEWWLARPGFKLGEKTHCGNGDLC